MSNEQKHRSSHGSMKWWIPVLISVGALVISYLSWRQSDEALEWTKLEAERERETRLYIDAEWTHGQLYLSDLKISPHFGSIRSEKLYEGIEAYTLLKISNQSDHSVSIERLKCHYLLQSGVTSINWGKVFKSEALKEDITFPVMLQPHESFRAVTRIPVPVTERVAKPLQKLKPDSLYSSLHVFALLAVDRAGVSLPDVIAKHTSKEELKRLQSCFALLQQAKNLPEVLIIWSDSSSVWRRGERRLEIAVTLGSGEVYVDTVDYIDINRSVWEF